jgi:hypothetical protein
MSASLKVHGIPELDSLEHEARALGGEVKGEGVKRVIGRAIANVLKEHFIRLAGDSAHHRTAASLGAKRTGFYSEAARGVQQPQLVANGVAVPINQVGLAQRLFGGIIRPVKAKFLTIPARSQAYGKRASEFDNLRAIFFPKGKSESGATGALIAREATVSTGKRKGQSIGGEVYFWLVKTAKQKADPTVLPTDSELGTAALNAARSFVARLRLRKAAA